MFNACPDVETDVVGVDVRLVDDHIPAVLRYVTYTSPLFTLISKLFGIYPNTIVDTITSINGSTTYIFVFVRQYR